MGPPDRPPSVSPAALVRSELALGIIAGAAVLALLYAARVVLIPIALAVILSLAIAPLVRRLRRFGLGHAGAVLVAAGTLAAALVVGAAVIVVQLVHVAGELPRYEATLVAKARSIERRFADEVRWPGQSRPDASAATASPPDASAAMPPGDALGAVPAPLRSLWPALQTAGIVLVVLLFVLLEYEPMRDRLIRLAGVTDLRATTAAINDAGERLSRYLVSQFAVNFAVGAVSGIGLALLGFPHATLWAALTMVLRFVPYVGFVSAALSAVLVAAAVDPGWSLALATLGLFVVVDVVAAQGIEPQLYGHMTGMSPLSVVVAALFWGWIWGPVGLVVSTPITLCLVVAGHHVRALGFLHILLGDAPGLTLPQHFYQRALSGDSDEIIEAARAFLKHRSLASYCDTVLWPAMRLTRADIDSGAMTADQLQKIRRAAVEVIDTLGSAGGRRRSRRRHKRNSVLDDPSPGRHLRHQREAEMGRWQGPLDVPVGSIVACVGLGSIGEDLATEVLVRVLRDLQIDARHLSIEDLEGELPHGASTASLAMACIVGTASDDWFERSRELAERVRSRFGDSFVVALVFAQRALDDEPAAAATFDRVARSFEEAAQLAIARVAPTGAVAGGKGP